MEQYLINGKWCERVKLSQVKKSQLFYIRRPQQVPKSMVYLYRKIEKWDNDIWMILRADSPDPDYDVNFKYLRKDKFVYVPME